MCPNAINNTLCFIRTNFLYLHQLTFLFVYLIKERLHIYYFLLSLCTISLCVRVFPTTFRPDNMKCPFEIKSCFASCDKRKTYLWQTFFFPLGCCLLIPKVRYTQRHLAVAVDWKVARKIVPFPQPVSVKAVLRALPNFIFTIWSEKKFWSGSSKKWTTWCTFPAIYTFGMKYLFKTRPLYFWRKITFCQFLSGTLN